MLLSIALLLAGCEKKAHLVEQRLLEFGTIIDITLIHPDLAKVEWALSEIERQLATYRNQWHAWEDSDLTRFNHRLAGSQSTDIPASLNELIRLSQQYYERSQQLFNPAIGKLIAAYGFHGSSKPDTELIKALRQDIPTMPDLVIRDGQAQSTNPALQLDFGGIAKGYALDRISDFLHRQGFEHFLINAGGDLQVSGDKMGKKWRIAIQNPFRPGAIAGINLSGQQALFTSGNYQRYYRQGDKIIHHIIDPRTGAPSVRISSATVLASDPVLADVAATSLMIDGLENHRSLAESLGIDDYLIITDDQQISVTRSFANKIEWISDLPVSIID
jgi:thiamine biosynthesis lipoprotein